MKNNHYFYILLTLLLSTLMIGCEQKTELANALPHDDLAITNRYVDECDDCPNMDDCCCEISWVSGSVEFELCGTSDGDGAACSDIISGCTTIDGLKNSSITFASSQSKLFCMAESQSFIIKNLGSSSGTLNVSCQYGQLSPQSINVVFTGPGTRVVSVDGDCEVSQCYP